MNKQSPCILIDEEVKIFIHIHLLEPIIEPYPDTFHSSSPDYNFIKIHCHLILQ
jgi:hypothetical protein